MEKLSGLVKEYRALKELSLDIVATAAGVSKEYLRLLENDKIKDPSIFIIFRIANVLKIPHKRIIEIANSQTYDLSEIADSIVESVSLNVHKQSIYLEFDENRSIKLIKFNQIVSNPSIKNPILKNIHSVKTYNKNVFKISGINAIDKEGNKLRIEPYGLDKEDDKLRIEPYANKTYGDIDFFVIFNKELRRENDTYEYEWWIENVNMFKLEFENFDKFGIGGPFRFLYYPTRIIPNFEIAIKHPKYYEVTKSELWGGGVDGVIKTAQTKLLKDNCYLTTLRLGIETDTASLKPGLYIFTWWYKIK